MQKKQNILSMSTSNLTAHMKRSENQPKLQKIYKNTIPLSYCLNKPKLLKEFHDSLFNNKTSISNQSNSIQNKSLIGTCSNCHSNQYVFNKDNKKFQLKEDYNYQNVYQINMGDTNSQQNDKNNQNWIVRLTRKTHQQHQNNKQHNNSKKHNKNNNITQISNLQQTKNYKIQKIDFSSNKQLIFKQNYYPNQVILGIKKRCLQKDNMIQKSKRKWQQKSKNQYEQKMNFKSYIKSHRETKVLKKALGPYISNRKFKQVNPNRRKAARQIILHRKTILSKNQLNKTIQEIQILQKQINENEKKIQQAQRNQNFIKIDAEIDRLFHIIKELNTLGYTYQKIDQWIAQFCQNNRQFLKLLLFKTNGVRSHHTSQTKIIYKLQDKLKIKQSLRKYKRNINGIQTYIQPENIDQLVQYIEEVLISKQYFELKRLQLQIEQTNRTVKNDYIEMKDDKVHEILSLIQRFQQIKRLKPLQYYQTLKFYDDIQMLQSNFGKVKGFNKSNKRKCENMTQIELQIQRNIKQAQEPVFECLNSV